MENEREYFEKVDQWVADDLWDDWDWCYDRLSSTERFSLSHSSSSAKISDETLAKIVDSISFENLGISGRDGDSPFGYKGNKIIDVLKNKSLNVFDAICVRLNRLAYDDEEIPLVVALVELLSVNVRDFYDYRFSSSRLDNRFVRRLSRFEQKMANPRLTVIIWAVYMETKVRSKSALKETFPLLPPYLQIKCVRKLFQLMDLNKIQRSVDELYKLIGGTGNNLCVPLEITFQYLRKKMLSSNVQIDNNMMVSILSNRKDHVEWKYINQLVPACAGRLTIKRKDSHSSRSYHDYTNGFMRLIKENDQEVIMLEFSRKMVDPSGCETEYNNKYFNDIKEFVSLNMSPTKTTMSSDEQKCIYYFCKEDAYLAQYLSRRFNIKDDQDDQDWEFVRKNEYPQFCEGRRSNKKDWEYGRYFHWCRNRPCFRPPIVYQESSQWKWYTLLDFMRILGISADYTKKDGTVIPLGGYSILASYFQGFSEYYKHLICRSCKEFLQPKQLTNFGYKAVNTFYCNTPGCVENGKDVYLNRCFNDECGNSFIDSRDSQKCPNGFFICSQCGACCSTTSSKHRIENLNMTGGYISKRIQDFVNLNQGHWEQDKSFCFKCGTEMQLSDGAFRCPNCGVLYTRLSLKNKSKYE